MECIEYDQGSTTTEERRRRLQGAFHALLQNEPVSGKKRGNEWMRENTDVKCVALMVPIVVADILQPLLSGSECISKNREKKKRQTTIKASPQNVSPKVQRSAMRFEAYQAARTRVEKVLQQAHEDAVFLSNWWCDASQGITSTSTGSTSSRALASHSLSSRVVVPRPSTANPLPVVVMGVLTPSSWKELALFHMWQVQSHQESLQRRVRRNCNRKGKDGIHRKGSEFFASSSPLRYASVLLLSLQKIALHWANVPNTSSIFLKDLQDLLLPHQQLLLDLSWCLEPPFLYLQYDHNADAAEEKRGNNKRKGLRQNGNVDEGSSSGSDRGMSRAEMVFRSFLMLLSSTLEFRSKTHHAVGGRIGFFVRYSPLWRKMLGCSASGQEDGCYDEMLYKDLCRSEMASHSRMSNVNINDGKWEESGCEGLETVLVAVQRQCERVISALYGRRSNHSYLNGGTVSLPWIFGYGGSVSSLLGQYPVFISRIPLGAEVSTESSRVGTQWTPTPASCTSLSSSSSTTFPTRKGLKEVHALFSVLLGQFSDALGGWVEAAHFCQRLKERVERHGGLWSKANVTLAAEGDDVSPFSLPSAENKSTSPVSAANFPPSTTATDNKENYRSNDTTCSLFSWSSPTRSLAFAEGLSSWGGVTSHGAVRFFRPFLRHLKNSSPCGQGQKRKLSHSPPSEPKRAAKEVTANKKSRSEKSHSLKEKSAEKTTIHSASRRDTSTTSMKMEAAVNRTPLGKIEENDEDMWATDLSPFHSASSK